MATLTTVLLVSLFGSVHCAGMCGPLVAFAVGATEKQSLASRVMLHVAYHGGRLMTVPILASLGIGVQALTGTLGRRLCLAVLTFGIWLWLDSARAIDHAVALLIVTCPCALGLATPLAVTVALGRAARRRILIKGGEVLELLAGRGEGSSMTWIRRRFGFCMMMRSDGDREEARSSTSFVTAAAADSR